MFLRWLLVIVLILITGNLIFIDYRLLSPTPDFTPLIPTATLTTIPTETAAPLPTEIPTPTLAAAISAPIFSPKPKTNHVTYLPINFSGSATGNIWSNLGGTQFSFDTNDYPGLSEITFEANIKLFNGNGQAFFRLYDSTHGIGVNGSEISTGSQADTVVVSGPLNFFSGKNLILVQAKSLTADTAIFNNGKLKIVTKN